MSTGENELSAVQKPASLSDAAKEGQTVQHDGKTFTTIREGLAHILVPENARTELDPRRAKDADDTVAQSVFYNPIQQFNRDLSVLAIRAFAEDLVALRQAEREKKAARAKNRKPKRGTKRKADGGAAIEAQKTGKKTKSDDAEPGAAEIAEADIATEPVEPELSEEGGVSLQTPMEVDDKPEIDSAEVLAADHTDTKAQKERPHQDPETKPERKISFKILDALSATGLRALRYAHEIPFVTKVTANDLSKQATQSIQANVVHNKLEDKITAVTGNATAHMYGFVSHPAQADRDDKYDVIDLDPYGTAATFLDAAVQAVNDGGLLCVTCTDAGVWASCGYPEKCYSLYGGTPIKGLHSHEGGLRLILHSIATAAARYGMAIEPLLSLSIDYYARVFVRIYKSPAEVKFLAGKTMVVYSCDGGCGAWKPQLLARNQRMTAKNGAILYKHGLAQAPTGSPLCEHCGTKTHVSRMPSNCPCRPSC
jgi:tRNA (guanine26-N2/guanine27-N2)-dimethyltransferase